MRNKLLVLSLLICTLVGCTTTPTYNNDTETTTEVIIEREVSGNNVEKTNNREYIFSEELDTTTNYSDYDYVVWYDTDFRKCVYLKVGNIRTTIGENDINIFRDTYSLSISNGILTLELKDKHTVVSTSTFLLEPLEP